MRFYNIALKISSIFSFAYLLLNTDEPGFEFVFTLPIVFLLCYLFLREFVEFNTNVLFFPFFIGVSFLRYVVGPFLLCFSGVFFGENIAYHLSVESIRISIFLMNYELVICSIVLCFLFNKNKKICKVESNQILLPQTYFFYMFFVVVTLLFVLVNPESLMFFSIAVWGMNGIDPSSFSTLAQITIMLMICSKFILFWVILCKIKERYDVSNFPLAWEILGFVVTCFFGSVYYGINRAQFLFSLITSFLIFILLFPRTKKIVVVFATILGIFICSYMTEQRNYFDAYSYEKGARAKILNASQTIASYFGGVGNVAVGVDMSSVYAADATFTQLMKDVLLPIVGLNKIVVFDNRMTSNNLFNYVFFNSKTNTSQILPSIAHGYFFFGPVFCILLDVIQLMFVFLLMKILAKTRRMELLFLVNVVLCRFSLMFGQNITQQINGIAMQMVLPLVVFFINDRISLVRLRK